MADKTISALPASTTPLVGTEVLPIVQGGTTKQVSVDNLTAGKAVSAASLSLTTSPLGVSSGGTNTNATPTAGAVAYGTGTAYAFTAAGTAGQALVSQAGSAPAFQTLPVAGGGTGTAIAYTKGSVIFAGTSGTYSSNTTNFFWDDTNFRLGIGTSTPSYSVEALLPGTAAVKTIARFGTTGNGGSGRGAGLLFGASGSSSSVDVAQIVGYQNAASATANSAALAFQVANTSGTLTEAGRFDNTGNFTLTGTGGLGYGTGSGGAVTQATSRTTGVTLNKTNGAITLVSAAGTATWQSFTVTNSTVAATDVIHVCQKSGTDLYQIHVTNVAAGSFQITFATTGGTTTEQPVFNFAITKAVMA